MLRYFHSILYWFTAGWNGEGLPFQHGDPKRTMSNNASVSVGIFYTQNNRGHGDFCNSLILKIFSLWHTTCLDLTYLTQITRIQPSPAQSGPRLGLSITLSHTYRGHHMKRVLLSALLAATALQASAGILTNGSFESKPDGLTSWTTFASTGVFSNPPTSGTTTDGSQSAYVTALFGGPNNAADLEAFVGVTDAALRAIKSPAGYTPAFINGGAIQQSFDVAGGETLKFDWRFATNETATANDFSFFVLDGIAVALGDTGGTGTVFESGVAGYTRATKWITYTYPDKLDAGPHTLSFAALQGANTSRDSSLLVDNVRLTSDAAAAIPEPVSLGLVGLGLLAFGCNRRRKA